MTDECNVDEQTIFFYSVGSVPFYCLLNFYGGNFFKLHFMIHIYILYNKMFVFHSLPEDVE